METSIQELLPKSLKTGFLDATIQSSGEFRPHLVLNEPQQSKVLSSLLRELEGCSSFAFSVAFITAGGLAMLQQGLRDAEARGVRGKILTSDYLHFTDPRALEHLMNSFPSLEVRISRDASFHAKGYLFNYEDKGYSSLILGSSNITQGALATNKEWNVRLVSLSAGELLEKTVDEFTRAWDNAFEVSQAWLIHYTRIHEAMRNRTAFVPSYSEDTQEEDPSWTGEIIPNTMQEEALQSLTELRSQGKKKALIISATGTGKTFLAAFAVQRYKPKRFLFLVHRQQIAMESMRKFQQILGKDISCGLLGAGVAEVDVQYLFGMIQTLSQDNMLSSFASDHFDYIVVDEVHRSGAASYLKVLSYFTPSFLLGMTATPERTDGNDIYSLFDHTIAYEIRLNQALEAGLLCPFHYYGISALSVDDEEWEDLSQFSCLENPEKIRTIKQMLDRYSIGTYRRRGLIFCSRNDEARVLSQGLNSLGLKTLAVSGEDSAQSRDRAFERLCSDDDSTMLEYLITVDIFNEGVDIPSLNQVVMLRPTQSAIIFVQQLGRGLRKYPEKEYLTVIDFIANYTNNYMIPIALYGDVSYKKDSLRRLVSSGSLAIQGASTVNFDKIAKEKIYKAINNAPFQHLKLLKQEFMRVQAQLNRIPTMMDFVRLFAISPHVFIEKYKSYYAFKSKIGLEGHTDLTPLHLKSLSFLSKILANGIRPYEIMVVRALVEGKYPLCIEDISSLCSKKYGFVPYEQSIRSALLILEGGFFKAQMQQSFGEISYITWQGEEFSASSQFLSLLSNETYRNEVEDILHLGEHEYSSHYWQSRGEYDLVLYQKYTRQDACRLLNWQSDDSSTIYGFRIHTESRTCPIFVTYHKDKDTIDSSIDYHDEFLSSDLFAWETRNNTYLHSKEPRYIRGEKGPIELLLFVQKNNDEGHAFYYMGQLDFLSNVQKEKFSSKGKALPIVQMHFKLRTSVQTELLEYITRSTETLQGKEEDQVPS